MNILITSVGRRTQLLSYFKKELNEKGKLVAADLSELAPALYIADKHYIVPGINDPGYIDSIMTICKQEKISGILSLIDPELSILAQNSKAFEGIGVKTIVSPYEACELSLDKYETNLFCEEYGFNTIQTYRDFLEFEKALEKGAIHFPVFIKPRKGSASIHIQKIMNMEEAKLCFFAYPDMIIQEYMDGQEIGVDVYIDLISKKVTDIFIKEKISMRAGETDKAKSIKSESLYNIIEEFVTKAGLIGPIDIDVFCREGIYYISEINPRFGGGYVHAYECGVNFPRNIINNLEGMTNNAGIGLYDENVFMMKHDQVMIKRR